MQNLTDFLSAYFSDFSDDEAIAEIKVYWSENPVHKEIMLSEFLDAIAVKHSPGYLFDLVYNHANRVVENYDEGARTWLEEIYARLKLL